MNRILVLGGYGGFGQRISRRLAEAGHEVLVAGRSLQKAERYCTDILGTIPVQINRSDIAEALTRYRPAALVDASGPFQGLNYDVPRACIAAGIHYCDIADALHFVCGIGELDAAAQEAGVVVVSGASSVPALSAAVVRDLAAGIDRVTAVEIAISASNRASAGTSVAEAILRQVGKPMALWRGKRWIAGYGWQEQRRQDFEVAGIQPITKRLVALVDVPDAELLPDRLPGRPECTFRAGTELGVHNRVLWLASWLVRWRLLSNLEKLAPALERLQGITRHLGSDRSAMIVRLFGCHDHVPVERRWTLIASNGDGPEIPSLSVPLIIDRITSGAEPAGARDAGQLLALADYQGPFDRLAITTDFVEMKRPPPLYRRVLGERFEELPESLQQLHNPLRDAAAKGEALVKGPSNFVARAVRRMMRFPAPGRHSLHVRFGEQDGVERWTRDFGGRAFSSELSLKGKKLQERFGPLRFTFDLRVDANGLAMDMTGWSAFGLRLPLSLAPRSEAREWDENGTFQFEVPISLPLVGNIIHYRGWLQLQ